MISLIKKNPAVKTVVNKLSKIDNVYRTYEMELLAGEENYMTNHVY
jgi:tRNA (guanine37-N1)-methyltransferase